MRINNIKDIYSRMLEGDWKAIRFCLSSQTITAMLFYDPTYVTNPNPNGNTIRAAVNCDAPYWSYDFEAW